MQRSESVLCRPPQRHNSPAGGQGAPPLVNPLPPPCPPRTPTEAPPPAPQSALGARCSGWRKKGAFRHIPKEPYLIREASRIIRRSSTRLEPGHPKGMKRRWKEGRHVRTCIRYTRRRIRVRVESRDQLLPVPWPCVYAYVCLYVCMYIQCSVHSCLYYSVLLHYPVLRLS